MSEIPKRYEYFLSPDGLRKLTQLMKSHFDSYVKKDVMYNDSKGLQYNGSVYNFGSEILLESNKLKMTRPPVRNITYGKDTTFYFDITYSDLTNTYDQQNLLACSIKKDCFVDSHTYVLKFENVVPRYVIRSTNTSAGNKVTPINQQTVQQSYVFKDLFYVTNDFPILVETYTDENEETITINHTLYIKDGNDFPTFYFHYNELTEKLVDSIDDGVITTVPITDDMNDLPVIWFTVKSFNELPSYELNNNLDIDDNPILVFGTDGNGVTRLYPDCYNSNLPHELRWYLKVNPKDDFEFLPDVESGDHSINYNVPIKSISLVYNDTVFGSMNENGSEVTIDIPDDMILYLDPGTTFGSSSWHVNRRTDEDWDWDSIYYNNPNYAYHLYDTDVEPMKRISFTQNHTTTGNLRPGFRVKFRNEYLYEWETDLIKATSGIHVDSTDERSNNGVIEKNGVSHNLGEFDGLPKYMQVQLDEKIHRSHMEVYSIRDHNNMYNQLPMEKQTAGLILDSGIPQNQLPEMITDEPHILYDIITSNKYSTVNPETILSENNVLSNIVYVDTADNLISDHTKVGMNKYARFFYHGNNYFSLSVMNMDPDTEFGRGFITTNDPASYSNNEMERVYVKPPRTIARICDIPTSMLQLSNIPDYAPTILIDWNTTDIPYVRTLCNYSIIDKEKIMNNKYDVLIRHENVIFPNDYDLDSLLQTTGDRYKIKENLNGTITLTFDVGGNSTVSVDNGGTDYEVNNEFKFNIGGRYFTGTVTDVSGNGVVVSVSLLINNNDFTDINVRNLKQSLGCNTTSISGSGSGLKIRLEINENIWNGVQPKVSNDFIDGLYVYKYDGYGHVWIWTYDSYENKWNPAVQVTGTNIIENPYDMSDPDERKIIDAYMFNLLNNNRKLYYETFTTKPDSYNNITKIDIRTDLTTTDISVDDISNLLDDCHINYQNSYYIPKIVDTEVWIERFTRYPYDKQDAKTLEYHNYVLPRFNTLNVSSWFNIANRLSYSIMKDKTNSQPDVYYYNPIEKYCTTYDDVSTDYCSIKEKHEMTFCDIMMESLDVRVNLYVTMENIYRYDEYSFDTINDLRYTLNDMTRDEVLSYIRTNYGDNAQPIVVDATNPFTKSMMIDYCLMVPQNPYEKPKIKRIAQKYSNVAMKVELEDGTSYITPVLGEQPTGMFESVSNEVHDLEYTTTSGSTIDSDISFVFTVNKHPALVDLRHFHMYDENNNDISEYSLLVYDNTFYYFESERDTWVPIV